MNELASSLWGAELQQPGRCMSFIQKELDWGMMLLLELSPSSFYHRKTQNMQYKDAKKLVLCSGLGVLQGKRPSTEFLRFHVLVQRSLNHFIKVEVMEISTV